VREGDGEERGGDMIGKRRKREKERECGKGIGRGL